MSAGRAALHARVDAWLATDLDAWTREVLARHFDPETGSRHWLRRVPALGFDPRDVTRYAELTAFGPFDLDDLRTGDPRDLVPLAVPRPLAGQVWESGGTTGTPGKVLYTPEMREQRSVWRMWSLSSSGVAPGGAWLLALPSGPHLIGRIADDLVERYEAVVHTIDMDPRWVKRLVRQVRVREADDYAAHLFDQIEEAVLGERIEFLGTTSALLARLIRKKPDLVAELRGVLLSGTQITADMYRDFRAALGDDVPVITNYGNTYGNCVGIGPESPGGPLRYLPQYPHVTTAVGDFEDWTVPLAPGDPGRVRLTVLQRDLFLPNVLERDRAVRYDPGDGWPAEGVADVGPLSVRRATPEGLY